MGDVLWTFIILNIVPKTIPIAIGEIQPVRELNSIMRTSCNNNYIINIEYKITVECNAIILILSFKRYKYYPVSCSLYKHKTKQDDRQVRRAFRAAPLFLLNKGECIVVSMCIGSLYLSIGSDPSKVRSNTY